ncbi:zinc finger protein interacting with ribonucleoprotein K [Bicyclus anynana]|uniref:Zinc finger protein interacting with ribonucleoprotein K n=1 Tax=Bicyclus anynana TaxID=110368 RepID=A0A6J1PB38_BICAN|nr:zinc finger protein interacting with ribonucleoprotein K [Bicyclus anynana]
MESYVNIYNSICRLCLRYNDCKKMISLIDGNSVSGLSPHAKAVLTFAKISISKEDCFPSNMCLECLYLLKQAIRFKLVTESSDNCLKNLKSSACNDSENFKDNIVEYTMLKFYFPTESFTETGECFTNMNALQEPTVKQSSKKYKKHKKFQLSSSTSCMYDDVFDNYEPESDTESTSRDENKVLNEFDNNIDSKIRLPTPTTVQKVFIRKKQGIKRRKLLTRENRLQKDLLCNICNKILANQYTYKAHMQKHNGYRFICEHCGKGYPVYNVLQAHQLLKHSMGPYRQCSYCPFKAPGKIELTEHERIHSGERPYTCDKCGLTFRRRAIWRKHLLHHSEKKIQCSLCPRKFYLKSDMLAHVNNIHNRVYMFSCSECGATYTSTKTVRRHMTERHGIPREMQGKIMRVNKRADGDQE